MVKNEIKVFARLKPESKGKNTVNYQIHRRPKKQIEEDYLVLNVADKSSNDYINNRPDTWNFAFHQIFDSDIKQDEIFEKVSKPVIQSVLNGYNATIFAYGQTGSGKTFSITGDPDRYEDRGIIPRTVEYLFQVIQKNPDNLYSVEIAYLEIYNENGYDLLDPKHDVVTKLEDLPRVTIQEDETGTLHLKNLSFLTVDNEKEALDLLFLGDTNRSISETPMNLQSSRSHCIFTIAVTVKESGSEKLSKAKMHLVDLAGSERVYKCCISGNILTEAKYINLSLHYLEQVIVCLGQPNVSHIPYRNSLLTAILRDSLGGNCLTTMLATLSLNKSNFEETISTCRFSQRVALIRNDVSLVLARNTEDENKFLKIEIDRLRKQIAELTEPFTSDELTADEERDLDNQVDKFLQSEVPIDWGRDDRKVKYCLRIIRQKLMTSLKFTDQPEKDLNYYRNLVVQRDKEISALIAMLKKTGSNSSDKSANDLESSSRVNDFRNERNPTISRIAKKVRLENLMAEARSIAELIKNGKASIGDLKKRMSDPGLVRTELMKMLCKNLESEQSNLAENLARLKSLKSEVTDLKTALTPSSTPREEILLPQKKEHSNFFANELRTDSTKSFDVTSTDSNFGQASFTSTNRDLASSLILIPTDEETGNADRFDESSNYASIEEGVNLTSFSTNEASEVVKKNRKDSRSNFSRLIGVGSGDLDQTMTDHYPPPVEMDKFVSYGFASPDPLKAIGRHSRRSLPSENSSGMKNSLIEKKELVKSPRTDSPIGKEEAGVSSSKVVSDTSRISNFSETDFELPKSNATFPECDICTPSDSTVIEEITKEGPSEFISSHHSKQRAEVVDDDDSSFIKSLPLTGDPEIDEEIVAFYRAKKSGGTY